MPPPPPPGPRDRRSRIPSRERSSPRRQARRVSARRALRATRARPPRWRARLALPRRGGVGGWWWRRDLFRLAIVADDAFERAQGDDETLPATGHQGDRTQGHGITPFVVRGVRERVGRRPLGLAIPLVRGQGAKVLARPPGYYHPIEGGAPPVEAGWPHRPVRVYPTVSTARQIARSA